MKKRSVFIIGGGGMVGATSAHALALKQIASEIVLIDVAEALVQGQATDLNHATAFNEGVRVRVGEYHEIQEDDVCVITCGFPRKEGQTRLDLAKVNADIVREVVRKIMAQGRPVYILMVTNPVDVLTYVALKTSGLPKSRVFGTGTVLDTARMRVTLANKLEVVQSQIQAYVLGEHGDSSFTALASATVGGIPLASFPGFDPKSTETIDEDTRRVSTSIIAAKKSTYYGISHVVAKVVEALWREDATVLPVCSLAEGEYGLPDVVLGFPSLVSSKGVSILDHYPLSEKESKQLLASAEIVRSATASLYSDSRV